MIDMQDVFGFVLSIGVLIWITHIVMTTDMKTSSDYFVDPDHRKPKKKKEKQQ